MATIIYVRKDKESKSYIECLPQAQDAKYALKINDEFLIISKSLASLANAEQPELKVRRDGFYTFESIKLSLDWLFVNHDYSDTYNLNIKEIKLFEKLFDNAKAFVKVYGKLDGKLTKKLYGLHVCFNHGGKMAGIHSISTNSMLNPFCIAHQKLESCVCSKCYAVNLIKSRPSMFKPLTINQLLLSNFLIDYDILPVTESKLFRFEAFGDLGTETQVLNYLAIASVNRQSDFALWTKNPLIIKRARDTGIEGKPLNLQMVFSGYRINQQIDINAIRKVFPFIDRVFIVNDKSANVVINCGAKDCKPCQICYHNNGVQVVNEQLKMTKEAV